VCKDNSQTNHNHIVAGDAFGSIMILDLNKKMKVARREVGSGKRISKVAIGSRDFAQDDQQTVQRYPIYYNDERCCDMPSRFQCLRISLPIRRKQALSPLHNSNRKRRRRQIDKDQ
jgi:hypothetical protein